MYKLYEYRVPSLKVGVIVSDAEQLLYIGSTLYSARTNITSDKQLLNSDITGRGLVTVQLNPFTVTINGQQVEPTGMHEESEKYSIIQYWNNRLQE